MKEGDVQEFTFGEYNVEYFEENQLPLEDSDYPQSMFEQIIPMAPIIALGDPIPICNYRGLKIKKEFRKYKEEI